jgi:hypothetical protein
MTATRKSPPAALQKLVHFITAFVVITKGIAKLEHPEGYWPVIVFLFAAGAYIVAVTLLHDRLHAHVHLIDASVAAIECLVMGIVTWLYVTEGKRFLPWVTGVAAVLFAVAFVVRLTRGSTARHDEPGAHGGEGHQQDL